MKTFDEKRLQTIKEYINDYYSNYRKSPTLRNIENATGISKSAVQRYLIYMEENGEIEYNGRSGIETSISKMMNDITPVTIYDSTVSCGLPTESEAVINEVFPFPTSIIGRGNFFALTAKGDSMINAGIDDGDLVIIREQNYCNDGEYAVVLVNNTETLLKTVTYLKEDNAYLLHAENEKYKDRIEKNAIIQGVAIKVIKNLNKNK